MRGLKVLLTSLTILLVLCTPAFAQSAPAASQYRAADAAPCPDGANSSLQESDVNSADDGACASAENAGQGTAAVNDALSGTASSASASASPESDESGSEAGGDTTSTATVSTDDADNGDPDGEVASAGIEAGDEEGLASITELPETGGAPLAALGLGVSLVVSGLAMRKVARE